MGPMVPSDCERRVVAYQLTVGGPSMGYALQTFTGGAWRLQRVVSGKGAGGLAGDFVQEGPLVSRTRGPRYYPDDPGTDGRPPKPVRVFEDGSTLELDTPGWDWPNQSPWFGAAGSVK